METHIQATEDSLIDTLSFKLPNTANFIQDRRSVSFFPSGSNNYSPKGVKIMKFMLAGTDWLDPSTVRIQFTLNNTDPDKRTHGYIHLTHYQRISLDACASWRAAKSSKIKNFTIASTTWFIPSYRLKDV